MSIQQLFRLPACFVLCVLFLCTLAVAQSTDQTAVEAPPVSGEDAAEEQPADVPAGHSQHGEAFNEGPRQQAFLMGGTGGVHFPVTTDNPQVQKFVDQGVGQLHGYWRFEAERSFRQAATLDPKCAIAYWGMAQANINNSTRAVGFIAEAMQRKGNSSRREALFIETLNRYLTGKGSSKDRRVRLIKDYEAIVKQFPDDLEAKAMLGYVLYKYRSDSGRSYEDVDRALKDVLAVQPMHPVHHYRIHLWDYKDSKKALDSSALAGQSAPDIAHMWHMPGHIYSRLKRYEDAAWQQEASARVDHAHMMRDRVLPDQIHNFAHNNEWLVRSLMYVGRWQDALDLAKNMAELPQHPRYNTLTRRGSAYYGRLRLFSVLSQFEAWEELIKLASTHLGPTDKQAEQIKRLHYLGVAYAQRGQADCSSQVMADLRRRLKQVVAEIEREPVEAPPVESTDAKKKPAKRRKTSPIANTRAKLQKAVAAVKAHTAMVNKDYEAAIPLLKSAGENAMTIARVQCLAGQGEEGVKTAEKYVKSQQNRVGPLAQYVEVLWRAGRKEKASQEFQKLRKLSAAVQFGSPVFDRLAPIAAELKLPADWRICSAPNADVGDRPDLDELGPFRWQPTAAPQWELPDHTGTRFSLKQYHGRPVVVIFYLGYGCLHCAQQLQAFAPMAEKFRQAGIQLVAISTDDVKDLQQSVDAHEGGMPFPLLSDAEMNVFRQYRAYDDFEKAPLHGTYLIDGRGDVRWQDISYEPFMKADFLLQEAQRLLQQDEDARTGLLQNANSTPIGR